MSTLSITCIGHNEKEHLEELIPQLQKFADEIIYVDCESQDHSFETAQKLGCSVYRRPNNMNLNVNKTFAQEQATKDWIFYIDPDERLSNKLIKEIKDLISSPPPHNAYTLNRRNHFFGHWLRYGGQYPDTQLRLFKKGAAHFNNQHVHEKLNINGTIGHLKNDMFHFPYLNVSQFIKKFDFYSSFEADYLFRQNKPVNWKQSFRFLFLTPLNRFFRRYILKLGFLDGIPGFFAAFFDAAGWITRYVKLWEKNHSRSISAS